MIPRYSHNFQVTGSEEQVQVDEQYRPSPELVHAVRTALIELLQRNYSPYADLNFCPWVPGLNFPFKTVPSSPLLSPRIIHRRASSSPSILPGYEYPTFSLDVPEGGSIELPLWTEGTETSFISTDAPALPPVPRTTIEADDWELLPAKNEDLGPEERVSAPVEVLAYPALADNGMSIQDDSSSANEAILTSTSPEGVVARVVPGVGQSGERQSRYRMKRSGPPPARREARSPLPRMPTPFVEKVAEASSGEMEEIDGKAMEGIEEEQRQALEERAPPDDRRIANTHIAK